MKRTAYQMFCEKYGLKPEWPSAKEQFADYCKQYELDIDYETDELKPAPGSDDFNEPKKPGRKPKLKSGAMTAAERKAAERQRRQARGEVQMWLTPEEVKVIEQLRART
ncbi:hypothetical protein [Marinobacterium litorale]|uniref:hypothetical protein n=1 Tax=Marinobacterium litorale TaxID=404770 RepID=UPI000486ECB3|nr:hypothetical protein [Marinobacterium litorale]